MTDSNYLSRNQNSPASKTSEGRKSYFGKNLKPGRGLERMSQNRLGLGRNGRAPIRHEQALVLGYRAFGCGANKAERVPSTTRADYTIRKETGWVGISAFCSIWKNINVFENVRTQVFPSRSIIRCLVVLNPPCLFRIIDGCKIADAGISMGRLPASGKKQGNDNNSDP
jgi:hypothetical protein